MEAGVDAFECKLRLHLRSRAVHQHNPDAHRIQQRYVLDQRGQLSGFDQAAGKRDHESAPAVRMDVGRDLPQPGDELRLVGGLD